MAEGKGKTQNSVNSVEINIGSGALAQNVKPVLTAARTVQGIKAKNSLSALTKDLIMQYPAYLDAAIASETQVTLVKADERMIAALQMALWSADTAFGIDPTSTGGMRDFIRKYHINDDTPDMVSYAGNLTRNISAYRGQYTPSGEARESALFEQDDVEVEILSMKPIRNWFAPDDIKSLWDTTESRIAMESINDLYFPADHYCDAVHQIAAATEAANQKRELQEGLGPTPSAGVGPNNEKFAEKYARVQANGYKVEPYYGGTKGQQDEQRKGLNNAKNVTLPNDRITSLEPTLLDVEFFVKNGQNGTRIQHAIVGIKVMPRTIASNAMASNIITALQGNNKAFQFVKWTRGETKIVRDLIFNVSQIKADSITKDKFDGYFAAMRKRKNNAKAFKFGDNDLNPFSTMIISMQTAELIKNAAGYDLTNPAVAKRLIDCLYLLGVQIVDDTTGIVSTIMDGWDNYSDTTVKALKGTADKETDMTQLKEVLRIVGRSY